MEEGELPATASEVRDWLRGLKKQAGLSYEAIADAIGEEKRNVTRWMTVSGDPVIPRGDVMLRLLTALGVKIDPPPPDSAKAFTALVIELRAALDQAEALLKEARAVPVTLPAQNAAAIREVATLTEEGFARLESGIADVAKRLERGEPGSRRERPS